jgi:broad specificity phosphatase PhoE
LWVVRHGESAGNVAREAALNAGHTRIEVKERDVDVPLSERGKLQSKALGKWFASQEQSSQPEVVVCSPYLRAQMTGELIRRAGGLSLAKGQSFIVDERLREKEFGMLDRLTAAGILQLYPDQAEPRRLLGKFYYRPPSGESWCDVILRLRSALDYISLHHGGRRVLILTHQVVVLCLRYLLENLNEETILAIDREGDVVNCGITEYCFDPAAGPDGGLVLLCYNFVAPLESAGAPVTSSPDVKGVGSS